MTDNRDLVQRVARGIEASQTTSATPAGQSEPRTRIASEGQVEAINQVFALFRLNYHNQYYAAFPDAEQLKQIKKLWLEALAEFPPEQVLRGAKHAIENSEYLPTLHRMLDCCRDAVADLGLPSATDAYREACAAPSPRSAQPWSHPAVYLAGRRIVAGEPGPGATAAGERRAGLWRLRLVRAGRGGIEKGAGNVPGEARAKSILDQRQHHVERRASRPGGEVFV